MKRSFKKLEKREDWLVALFYLVVTIVYASQIPSIKHTKISPVDSRFLPIVLCIGMSVLTLCQMYNALKNHRAQKTVDVSAEEEQLEAQRPEYRRAMMTLASSLLYVAILQPVGFVISSILYLELQMCVMAPREKRKPLRFLFIAVVAVAVVYFVFHNLLKLMLPSGILTGIL